MEKMAAASLFFFKRNFLAQEKTSHQIIPQLVYGMVYRENPQGGTCSAGQPAFLKLTVEEKTVNVFRVQRQTGGDQHFFRVFPGKLENNFKMQRCSASFDQRIAVRLYFRPETERAV